MPTPPVSTSRSQCRLPPPSRRPKPIVRPRSDKGPRRPTRLSKRPELRTMSVPLAKKSRLPVIGVRESCIASRPAWSTAFRKSSINSMAARCQPPAFKGCTNCTNPGPCGILTALARSRTRPFQVLAFKCLSVDQFALRPLIPGSPRTGFTRKDTQFQKVTCLADRSGEGRLVRSFVAIGLDTLLAITFDPEGHPLAGRAVFEGSRRAFGARSTTGLRLGVDG